MKNHSGFTLLETLVYSGIVAGIITVALLTAYQFIDGSDRLKYHWEMVENQKILEQKIYWTLQNISAINSPSAGATTTSLSINKLNFASNPVVIDSSGGIARLQRGGGAFNPITTELSEVRFLTFHRDDFDGRPAIKVDAEIFNPYSSTTIEIHTTIITK